MNAAPGASPPGPATARYGMASAPDDLALVQDLLNTSEAPGRVDDLLEDRARTGAWLLGCAAAFGDERLAAIEVSEELRLRLVSFRSALTDALAGRPSRHPISLALTIDSSAGRWDLVSQGPAEERLLAELVLSVRDAQRIGHWSRLKRCANGPCPCVFYDRSKNNSRRWHAIRGCGNPSNLRDSRRRRAAHRGTLTDAP